MREMIMEGSALMYSRYMNKADIAAYLVSHGAIEYDFADADVAADDDDDDDADEADDDDDYVDVDDDDADAADAD